MTPIDAANCNVTVSRFAPLVMRVARQLAAKLPRSVELGDMVQAGMIGLMDAATRYDAEQGVQFEAFATQRVRGAMLDELRSNDWVPRRVRKAQRDIDAAIGKLQQRLGRKPREAEIAGELGVTLPALREMLVESHAAHVLSLDDSAEQIDAEHGARAPERGLDPARKLQEERFRRELAAAIEQLPEREARIMSLHYEHELTYLEIAAIFGVTESRVCQLHTQAVKRLRARLVS